MGAAGAALMAGRAAGARLLAVIFLALAGVLVIAGLSRRDRATTPVVTPIVAPFVFPEVFPADITEITLENRRTNRILTLDKVPGGWRAADEAGQVVEIDVTKVPRLLRILSTLRYNRTLDDSALEAYGLADGGWLIVRFRAGSPYTLRIGDNNPGETLTYVRRGNDGPALLVAAESVSVIAATMEGLQNNSAP
ncbi:MAG: DUF4340 domain-containing protein [Anaerolineae bacterium]|nr:DUF4340 domain-containing protein [Anaerolineae bacterium]